jgi:hypothetical protein
VELTRWSRGEPAGDARSPERGLDVPLNPLVVEPVARLLILRRRLDQGAVRKQDERQRAIELAPPI